MSLILNKEKNIYEDINTNKLNLQNIKDIFINHKPKSIKKMREVSVLIAIMQINKKNHIIFQKRSGKVPQAGDISFIGGHVEKGENPKDSVIREAMEECNLNKDNIEIFGQSDYLINYSGLHIYVFVGQIKDIQFCDIRPNDEVEHLIAIDLDDILSTNYKLYSSNLSIKRDDNFPYHLIEKGKDYDFFVAKEEIYFYEFKSCIIWGLSARILKSFIDILKRDIIK